MRRVSLVLSGVVMLLVVGCGAPPPTDELLSQSLVLTKYAPGVDFSTFHTFYLRPEIRTLKDDGSVEIVDPDKAQPFLDATESNLVARGYESLAVADKDSAELAVELDYLAIVSSATWCYSWYDSGYWGYPGYPYYPYYGGCGTDYWRSDMLTTHIVDLTSAQSNPDGGDGGAGGGPMNVPGIWFSGVYGVGLDSRDGVNGINQAFAQSPYLSSATPK